MASPRHLRAAELIAAGIEPEAAMVEAGWPAKFAADFASRVVAWLVRAGVLPDGFACPEPEAYTAEAVSARPDNGAPDFPETPALPDASASAAPSADADPASAGREAAPTGADAPAAAGETRPARRARRSRS